MRHKETPNSRGPENFKSMGAQSAPCGARKSIPHMQDTTEDIRIAETTRIYEKHVTVWSDGALTIEDNSPHPVHFTNSAARRLRKFLNKMNIKMAMGVTSCNHPPREHTHSEQKGTETRHVHLGQRMLNINEEAKTVAVGTASRGMIQLDAAETYRLFVALHELYKGGK